MERENFSTDDVFDRGLVIHSLDQLLEEAGFYDDNLDYLPLNERYRGETEDEAFYNSLVRERE